MKTLYIERSTGECRKGAWVEKLDLEGIERIVVGTGPGSFAGIRSALAFAQGYALGKPGMEVLGLSSACAIAADFYSHSQFPSPHSQFPIPHSPSPIPHSLTVIGDARQGKLWIAEFEGYNLVKDIYQIEVPDLNSSLFTFHSSLFPVVSPDDKRIGSLLKETFGDRYLGERMPTAEGLRLFAEANPAILVKEPLPIYLNPAVRS